jgi:hypothetical protein
VKTGNYPTTLSYCVTCQKDTPHELLSCEEGFIKVCEECVERALRQLYVGNATPVAPNLGIGRVCCARLLTKTDLPWQVSKVAKVPADAAALIVRDTRTREFNLRLTRRHRDHDSRC